MDKLDKLNEAMEALKDLYINQVKNATQKYEVNYDSEKLDDKEENKEK